MKFSLQAMLLILTLTAVVGVIVHEAMQKENVPYRQYLNSLEGSDGWFRIGSYSISHDGSAVEFDLYYSDSDKRPDGPQNSFSYPNSFRLFCVWQLPDGSWSHKEIAAGSRTTFHKVLAEKTECVELQLRANFRMNLTTDDENRWENMRKIHDANQPYSRKLIFENGVPLLKKSDGHLPLKPPDAG